MKMPARFDVFGSPGVLEDDELPSISETIRFARYLQDNKGKCVSLNSLGKRLKDIFCCNIWTRLSADEVKTAILEKWRSAGDLFSPSSPLLMSDKAIMVLLTRTFTSATECIQERGNKDKRDQFLLRSGGLLNILKCK